MMKVLSLRIKRKHPDYTDLRDNLNMREVVRVGGIRLSRDIAIRSWRL